MAILFLGDFNTGALKNEAITKRNPILYITIQTSILFSFCSESTTSPFFVMVICLSIS